MLPLVLWTLLPMGNDPQRDGAGLPPMQTPSVEPWCGHRRGTLPAGREGPSATGPRAQVHHVREAADAPGHHRGVNVWLSNLVFFWTTCSCHCQPAFMVTCHQRCCTGIHTHFFVSRLITLLTQRKCHIARLHIQVFFNVFTGRDVPLPEEWLPESLAPQPPGVLPPPPGRSTTTSWPACTPTCGRRASWAPARAPGGGAALCGPYGMEICH